MKPLNLPEVRAAAQRRLVCAPVDCRCEKDCFCLAQVVLQLLPDPLPDEPDDPDQVADYAPDWSAS